MTRGGPLVLRVGGQARVPDLGHERVVGEAPGQLERGGLGALDPQREGAQPAQREPGLPRPGDGAAGGAAGVEPAAQLGVGGHRRAHDEVGVAGEVLRHRVHDDVGALGERALRQRRREGVVHHREHPGGTGRGGQRGDVGDLEHGVGRRLDPQQGGGRPVRGGERGDDGVGVGDVDLAHDAALPGGELVRGGERGQVGVARGDDGGAGRGQVQHGVDGRHPRGEDERGQARPPRAGRPPPRGAARSRCRSARRASPGPGTPVETYVLVSTTGGLTGAPCSRGGRPAATASVAGERPVCGRDWRCRSRGLRVGRSRRRRGGASGGRYARWR